MNRDRNHKRRTGWMMQAALAHAVAAAIVALASIAQADVNLRVSVEPRVALGIAYGGHFPKAAAVLDGVRRKRRST